MSLSPSRLAATFTLAAATCSREPSLMSKPEIHIEPTRPATDRPFITRIAGLDPGVNVHVELRAQSALGLWRSAVRVVADGDGGIDLGRDAPVAGSYEGVDAMGLVWSLDWEGTGTATAPDFAALSALTLLVIDDEASVLAQHSFTRATCFETVAMTDITSGGLRAFHFQPPGNPIGAALVLGGSEGGRPVLAACSLAAHGIETLALAYFGEEGLPEQLIEIPLEYVEQGLEHLVALSHRSEVAVVGLSKGAELGAVLASRRPDAASALVLYAPSAVVFQGVDPSGSTDARSSWSAAGTPLPFVRLELGAIEVTKTPVRLLESYAAPLDTLRADDPGRIAFEAIAAPVMTIAGDSDALWPSARMAAMITERRGQRPGDLHLVYPDAGHGVFLPYWPIVGLDPGLALGGTPAGTARGSSDSWPRVLEFLSASFGK